MFSLIYLLASFFSGFWFVSFFLPSIKGLAKLAASYLIGIFFFSWVTFLFALLFSSSGDPLRWGIASTFFVFLVALLFFKSKLKTLNFNLKINLVELVFLSLGLIFSFWIMIKSFNYQQSHFQIASNIFTDFNTHISVIRSFSWGKNFPPEMPFFAGKPIKYHFMTDFTFAIFEYLGWNIAWAVNIPSALAFVSLLLLIYGFSQELIAKNLLLGFISVVLFLFNSSLTFVKFFQKFPLSLVTPKQIWQLGEYLSAGPFDEGIISIFWNLNTFVNQRHFVFALGLFLLIFLVLSDVYQEKKSQSWLLVFIGALIGLMPLWHGLVFIAVVITVFAFWLFSKLKKPFFHLLLVAAVFSLPQVIFLLGKSNGFLPLLRPGFLIAENLSLNNFVRYWFMNLGLGCLTIPAGFLLANDKQRRFYFPFLALFILGNLFQFTPDMFNNHKLFNLWLIGSNFYSAYFLFYLFQKGRLAKLSVFILMIFLTLSGLLDLMVIKNDFLHQIADAPKNKLIAWVKKETSTKAVFLSPEELYYNPVNLAGRRTFFGVSHSLWQFGYQIDLRKVLTRRIYQVDNREERIKLLQETEVDYCLVKKPTQFDLPKVYEDGSYFIYQIAQK